MMPVLTTKKFIKKINFNFSFLGGLLKEPESFSVMENSVKF
jgi:hypothetical protein